MPSITALDVHDIRFPTSRLLDGSDAMNLDPDYSVAYVVLRTDHPDGHAGHGFTFTIGRGTEVCVAAIEALRPLVLGLDLDEVFGDLGAFARRMSGDSQLRWLGPEKGVIHLAAAAVINAVWDLYCRHQGKPLWQVLSEMSPEELVALVDFRYISDALTPEQALELLRRQLPGRAARTEEMLATGLPSYTTSAGWLGYDDAKLAQLCQEVVDAGWNHVKLKVGRDIEQDVRRVGIAREILGPDRYLMIDANQVWSVDEALANMARLAKFQPYWIEEPTSPDDVLGHARIAREIAPLKVATGEHVQNRIVFKQLLQAGAIGFCQIDACRLAGVNEVVAVLLLAAQHGVPVCPHAGGVGLCELVQHLSLFNYIAVTGSLDDVVVEYVDHLHEHFVDPVVMRAGKYVPPSRPGYSAEMYAESIARYSFPDGPEWAGGER
ncbi:MAG TPA: L-fuconate dehydratase [Pseudonocardia sp.]|nr:L-fuconate dehydratase [Pseudonocardia sp.]